MGKSYFFNIFFFTVEECVCFFNHHLENDFQGQACLGNQSLTNCITSSDQAMDFKKTGKQVSLGNLHLITNFFGEVLFRMCIIYH